VPGTSDSGELGNRILFRVRRALDDGQSSPQNVATSRNLGVAGGYNWIVLMQVSRYRDSNARLTNMRRGVQRFLDALASSRKSWPREQVGDTVTVWPYHFAPLGEARGRVVPLVGALDGISELKEAVPGSPQEDEYQGRKWLDGHDWRGAMHHTLDWMKQSDIEAKHTVVVVLDWNDLAQAPQTLADGTRPTSRATDKDLVLPTNPVRFKAFADAMQNAGLDPKQNLETVQVGNLEYDLAVFAPKNLEPLPVVSPTQGATPTATSTAEGAETGTGGNGGGALILIPLLALLGGAGFFLTRPVNFRLDENESRQVAALPAKTLPILGKNTQASGAHYRLSNVNIDTDRPLALIGTDFSKKLTVTNGALAARNSSGFASTPSGLKLTGQSGDFDLVDSSNDRVVASVSVRRL